MSHKIYAIRKDAPKYKQLDLSILDITRHAPEEIDLDDIYDFSLKNTEMSEWWETPETKYIDYTGEPPGLIPDISVWIDATLVLSPKAYRVIGELLKTTGEFLPVLIGKETYYLFNCLTVGEVDEANSKFVYADDIRVGVERLVFKESTSEHLLFKTPLENGATLFCSDRFKIIVDEYELNGVIFDEELIPEYLYSDH